MSWLCSKKMRYLIKLATQISERKGLFSQQYVSDYQSYKWGEGNCNEDSWKVRKPWPCQTCQSPGCLCDTGLLKRASAVFKPWHELYRPCPLSQHPGSSLTSWLFHYWFFLLYFMSENAPIITALLSKCSWKLFTVGTVLTALHAVYIWALRLVSLT